MGISRTYLAWHSWSRLTWPYWPRLTADSVSQSVAWDRPGPAEDNTVQGDTRPAAPDSFNEHSAIWHMNKKLKKNGNEVWSFRKEIFWNIKDAHYLHDINGHLVGHSVYFNTAVTSPEILGKLRFWTKKRARSISYNHIKMMQSMVYLISLFTLILIKWHVTSPEISGLVTSPVMTWYWGNLNKIWYWGILHT